MFPFMPFMMPTTSIPSIGAMGQLSAEETVEMQRLNLQNQQVQMKQMKQMLEQYSRSIDTALSQIEEQIAEVEKGGEGTVAKIQAQVLAQTQAQALSTQAQALNYRAERLADRLADRYYRSDRLVDPARMMEGGMGEFGRPIF